MKFFLIADTIYTHTTHSTYCSIVISCVYCITGKVLPLPFFLSLISSSLFLLPSVSPYLFHPLLPSSLSLSSCNTLDKPNPPGRISITHERSNGIFNRNNTYRISWEPPNSELENSTKQEYSLIMLTEVQKGSQCYVKDKEYFVYELRTNSTSVLYDRLCDFIMLDSNQRFFVAAVGQGGDYKEYSISDYVYSDSLPEIDGSSCFIPINFAAGEGKGSKGSWVQIEEKEEK